MTSISNYLCATPSGHRKTSSLKSQAFWAFLCGIKKKKKKRFWLKKSSTQFLEATVLHGYTDAKVKSIGAFKYDSELVSSVTSDWLRF